MTVGREELDVAFLSAHDDVHSSPITDVKLDSEGQALTCLACQLIYQAIEIFNRTNLGTVALAPDEIRH